ncbi:MAG TPA: GGDEF domain-containing protein [Actinoplanes sp.]|jgi:diguanylate cyclase (GGDEF)-like protein
MDGSATGAAQLSAALTAIEDRFVWDAVSTLEAAVEIEDRAIALGDDELAVRARLCQANMWMRRGDIAAAAHRIWKIHQWAVDNGARMVQARTHLVWANIHRLLGDAASALEHSVQSVELLDETSTPFAQVWHRSKLADSLGITGSMEAARTRYGQAEELAVAFGLHELHMGVLNNYAYNELRNGRPELARAVADRLQALAAAHGFALDPADLDTIGSIQIENGLYAEAEETMHRCIALHRQGRFQDADGLAEYLLTLATAQRRLGATDRAQASLDASRELCVQRRLGEVLVRVHLEQSELHATRGEFELAFAMHKVFFTAYDRLRSSQREAQARTRQAMFETVEARRDAERFWEQARRDPLTGLRNRRYVDERLPLLIGGTAALTIAIVDLDHFKRINDRLSHDVGDQVLVMVAKVLEAELAAVCPDGFVARLGGEEFLLVLPGSAPVEAATHLDSIRATIRGYAWQPVTHGLPVTVSIGVAGTPDMTEPTQPGLMSIADRNLYVAKHGGRDRVVTGTQRNARVRAYRDASHDFPGVDRVDAVTVADQQRDGRPGTRRSARRNG